VTARPVLQARRLDAAAIARVLHAVLLGEVLDVDLVERPRDRATHTLRLDVPDGRSLSVAAQPEGRGVNGAERLRLAPLDPSHVTELVALIRELTDFGGPPPSPPAADSEAPPSSTFDRELALISRSPTSPNESDADDMLTIPFRPSRLPPSVLADAPVHTTREPASLRSAFDEAGASTNRAWPDRVAETSATGGAAELPGPATGAAPGSRSGVAPPSFDPSAVMREQRAAALDLTLTPTDPIVSTVPRVASVRGAPNAPTGPTPSVAPETEAATQLEERTLASTASLRAPRTKRGSEVDVARGRRIANKYEIQGLVGVGAVGAVYRAAHSELGRTVAIKVLHPYYRTDTQVMAAFRAEARAASRLQHPNVTVVHDFGEEPDGLVYIVMEYLEGRTLQALLDAEHRLEPARAVAIMMQVCAALAAAHEWGIVHRDVKPDNIILVPTRDDDDVVGEIAKVCDFGIAALDSAPPSDADEVTTAGTPEYMAPEQIAGRADARTDVYACGIVLYEMLTGAPPFVGPSISATLERHANEAPRPLREMLPTIPPALEAVVLRALEKVPERRFPSMRELRLELKRSMNVR
jgi:hypothetical protein